jgi:hypothetical protein
MGFSDDWQRIISGIQANREDRERDAQLEREAREEAEPWKRDAWERARTLAREEDEHETYIQLHQSGAFEGEARGMGGMPASDAEIQEAEDEGIFDEYNDDETHAELQAEARGEVPDWLSLSEDSEARGMSQDEFSDVLDDDADRRTGDWKWSDDEAAMADDYPEFAEEL